MEILEQQTLTPGFKPVLFDGFEQEEILQDERQKTMIKNFILRGMGKK